MSVLFSFLKARKKAFTLIEILIVIGIIAILAAATIIAINPGRQFAQSRNTQRWSNVHAILNAVNQNMVDNQGNFVCDAGDIPSTAAKMATPDADGYDICDCLVTTYLAELPYDPKPAAGEGDTSYTSCDNDYDTGYWIVKGANDRITVSASSSELSETIEVTR